MDSGNNTKGGCWIIFLTFLALVFVKNVLFHYFAFNTILISSLWKNPLEGVLFYLPKFLPALFIAVFVLFTKRQWWTVVVAGLLDVWIISNMVYFRANGLYIDLDAILMVGNMNGFWDATLGYVTWQLFLFPLLTIIYAVGLWVLGAKIQRKPWRGAMAMLFCFALMLFNNYEARAKYAFSLGDKLEYDIKDDNVVGRGYNPWKLLIAPYPNKYYMEFNNFSSVDMLKLSIMHYFGAIFLYRTATPTVSIDMASQFMQEQNRDIHVNNNLIIILTESLETWPIQNGIMPCLSRFIDSHNVLYVPYLHSQVRHGVSGDGQMILNSGVLPIQKGAACMIYGDNFYPHFADFFDNSLIVDPCGGAWNQAKMGENYGYKDWIQVQADRPSNSDRLLMEALISSLSDNMQSTCVQAITIAMHSPFDKISDNRMNISDDAPLFLRRYINSANYTDSCMGVFFDYFDKSELKSNTTVVITGDHTVFKNMLLKEFQPYAITHQLSIPTDESFVPLIIYSPTFAESIVVRDTCYQMDIFPTILDVLDAEDYYWKGFGVSLLDSTAIHNRPISEKAALELSDIMVRNDYFK